MRKAFRYIFLTVALFALALSCKRVKVIPEGTLSKMYAEMYILDQWIQKHQDINAKTDTLFVYGELLKKYGYTPDDYRHTVSEYMKDPESYAKVFENAKDILNRDLHQAEARDSIARRIDSVRLVRKAKYGNARMIPLYEDILVGYYPHDTLSPGTGAAKYTLNIPVLDTIYSGPEMIVAQDTCAKADSL